MKYHTKSNILFCPLKFCEYPVPWVPWGKILHQQKSQKKPMEVCPTATMVAWASEDVTPGRSFICNSFDSTSFPWNKSQHWSTFDWIGCPMMGCLVRWWVVVMSGIRQILTMKLNSVSSSTQDTRFCPVTCARCLFPLYDAQARDPTFPSFPPKPASTEFFLSTCYFNRDICSSGG